MATHQRSNGKMSRILTAAGLALTVLILASPSLHAQRFERVSRGLRGIDRRPVVIDVQQQVVPVPHDSRLKHNARFQTSFGGGRSRFVVPPSPSSLTRVDVQTFGPTPIIPAPIPVEPRLQQQFPGDPRFQEPFPVGPQIGVGSACPTPFEQVVASTDDLLFLVDQFILGHGPRASFVPQGRRILDDAQDLREEVLELRADVLRGRGINTLQNELDDVHDEYVRLARRVDRIAGFHAGPNVQIVRQMIGPIRSLKQLLFLGR